VEVTLDTAPVRRAAQSSAAVEIGFLQSGDPTMSDANATCVSGCVCAPTILTGYKAGAHSVSISQSLAVTQHVACVVRVEVLPRNVRDEQGGADVDCKFKLRAFSVSFLSQQASKGDAFRSLYNKTAMCESSTSLFVALLDR